MSQHEISPPSFSNLSVSYLQYKFKLTHSAASTVADVFNKLKIDEIWQDVTINPPKHKEEVIAHGKSLASRDDEGYDTHIAYLDMRYGWMNRETNQSLYVTHWMAVPKQSVDDDKTDEEDKKEHKKKKIVEEEYIGPPKALKK